MQLFAHRGASAYAPENTLPAFRKALEMGARAVELDVQLSADGVPVVIHDFYLDKNTDGTGMVREASWREIRQLDAGGWFAPEFRGTRVPSLEEVLELMPRDICLNIELKAISLFREPTARRVMELLSQAPPREVILSSFNHPCLKTVREMDGEMNIGILTGSDLLDFPSYVRSTGLKPYSVHPEASYVTGDYVRQAHREGWKVICYTVNTADAAEALAATGADGFFSDYPDLLTPSSKT